MGTLKSEWWNALEGFETEEDVFEFIWERVNTKDFQDSRSCVMNIPEPSGYIKYSADDKRQSLYEFMMSIIEEKDTLLQKLTERDTEAERRRTEGNPRPLTLDELREMDGEPVLIDGTEFLVGINDIGYVQIRTPEGVLTLYSEWDYGKTWLAYRNRPKED